MLRLIAAFLMLWAIYVAVGAAQYRIAVYGLVALWIAVTAVSLWLRKQWSQYLVYCISIAIFIFWIAQMRALVALGWPYPDRSRSIISLLILSVPLTFGVGIGVHVFRVFRRKD
jgi:CDP-diglyceride synthetase